MTANHLPHASNPNADEAAARAQIRAHTQAGRRADALNAYLELEERLAAKGCTPEPETRALAETLLAPVAAPAARRLPRRALFGAAALLLAGTGWLLRKPSPSHPAHPEPPLSHPTELETANIRANRGIELYHAGQYEEALREIRPGVALFRRLQKQKSLAWALGMQGQCLQAQGRLIEARRDYDEAVALQSKGDPLALANTLNTRADLLLILGDLPAARASLDESLKLRQRQNFEAGVLECVRLRGSIRQESGDYEGARADFTSALRLSEKLNQPDSAAACRALLGTLDAVTEHAGRARLLLESSLRYWKTKGHPRWVAATSLRLAHARLLDGGTAQSLSLASEALSKYRLCGDLLGEADARLLRGRALTLTRRHAEAQTDLDAALAFYREASATPRRVRALRAVAHNALKQDGSEPAHEFFTDADALARQGGYATPPAERNFHLR